MSTEEARGAAPGTGRMTPAARERVLAEIADGHDATSPAFLYSVTSTSLLLAVASGLLDPVLLARRELAYRGLDADGTWVGFDRARQIHIGQEAGR
jgi:hypothetical protein